MAFDLRPVTRMDAKTLWKLLLEREPHQNISHEALPAWTRHVKFILSDPYKNWWIITGGEDLLGACYLTRQNEIGIQLFKKYMGKGYGSATIDKLIELSGPGKYLANINPDNDASIQFFNYHGFNKIQETYVKTIR